MAEPATDARAEESICAAHANELIANAEIGLALLDVSGSIQAVNPRLQQMLGYSEGELRGTDFAHLLVEREYGRPQFAELLNQERTSLRVQERLQPKDGPVFWADIAARLITPERIHIAVVVQVTGKEHEPGDRVSENEERFRLMVEDSREIFFFECDCDYKIVYVSPSIEHVTGFLPEEAIGRSFVQFMANDVSARLLENRQQLEDGAPRNTYVVEGKHKRGSVVTLEICENCSSRRAGNPTVRGFARDITAHRIAERQLQLSDQILQSIDAMVFVANGDGQVMYVSPSTTRLLGYSAPELLGYGWWRHHEKSPELQREAFETVAAVARGERPVRKGMWEEVTYDKQGNPHWLLWQETKGPGDLLIGVAQDITERKKMDEELSRRSLQLRAIFDSTVDGMFILDEGLQVVDANPAACRILGRTREQVLDRNVGMIVTGEQYTDEFWQNVRTDSKHETEGRIVRPDGTSAELELSFKSGILPGLHLLKLRDITDRKQLQQQFLQSQKMEALGRLAGGVAHDVNNMLMAIRGYGELLNQRPEAASRYVGSILGAVDRAALTTKQLLAFSRQQVVQPKAMHLNAVVIEMGKLLQRTIGEDIQLQMSLASDLGVIKADPGEIGQVLLNLAVNAKDAMPNGGKLYIETSNITLDANYLRTHLNAAPGEYVVLTVTDTGCGMDNATVAKIFEPFFTTKPPGKGTGLGLPTTYGIVKQAGGTIYVYSEPGEGTCFKVYFPRIDVPATPISNRHVEAPDRRTVLVLDDDAAAAGALCDYLESAGYNVLKACSGEQAMRTCEEFKRDIAVVISDVTMPGADGQDLTGFLAIRHPEAKMVYISGFSKESLQDRGVIPIDCTFLQKPFRFDDLRQVIERSTSEPWPGNTAAFGWSEPDAKNDLP